MLGWFAELTTTERKTFWACFGGWALDAMDVQFYSFTIPTLIATWGLSRGQAGLLGTSTLLISALGGWLAGLLADRVGRVRTLQITILWYAGFTFLSGLTQNFEQLLVTRGLMGLGFGGEWAAGAVLMGEMIRAEHRGKAVGSVQSGWAIGWGVSAILYGILFNVLPEATAWRVLFIVGVLPAVLVFFLRKHVPEPEVFAATQSRIAQGAAKPSLGAIFSPGLLRTTVLASLLATGAQGGYYAITNWLPTYLKTVRHLSVLNTTGYLVVVIIGSFVGYIVGAYLTDRLGRRNCFFLFAICCFLIVIAYTYLPISDAVMLVLGFPLGFFVSGIFSGMGAFFTELFPTQMRGSGQGFAYNFGRGVGALFPSLVGYLSQAMPLGQAIGIFAAIAYAVLFLAALLLPETRGKQLAAYG
ncbi:MAG TPA: MFS transporter [Alphaproteobacteria bacterium]|nr:MFS transporter [Alphaproteobacteria bacterium]